MTGLEEIEQFMAAGTRPPMMDLFDIDLLEAEEGKVVFVATPTSQTYNFMGIAHGGYAATLLDSACGIHRLERETRQIQTDGRSKPRHGNLSYEKNYFLHILKLWSSAI